MPASDDPAPSSRNRERQLLELLAYWGGGTTAQEFARALGTRREAAQAKIAAFRREYVDALRYDPVARRLRFAADPDVLRYSPADADRLLGWLLGEQIAAECRGDAPPLPLEVVDVSALAPHPIAPGVLTEVIAGIGRRRRLRIRYRSKQRSSVIRFSPHTIVWASGRHHARGYGIAEPYEDGRWIDLVLPRMLEVAVEGGEQYVSAEQDADWHARRNLVFRFAAGLGEDVREALRADYGLGPGEDALTIRAVRAALAPYVVRDVTGRRVEGRSEAVWMSCERQPA